MVAKRSGGRRSSAGKVILLCLFMLGLGLALGWFFSQRDRAPEPRPAAETQARRGRGGQALKPGPKGQPAIPEGSQAPGTSGTKDAAPRVNEEPATRDVPREELRTEGLPALAIVIDDLGYAPRELVLRLCAQPVPLSVAVLPFLENSEESARLAREKGKEVMLHLPMEPVGYPGPGKNPGPGAILHAMGEAEVRRKVREALLAVPAVRGVNNHMGSRITPDTMRMGWILEEVKSRNAFFLDSRTEKDTVALEVARKLGLRSLQRKVFLDDSKDFAEMERQWNRALALARKDGEAVIIGHIYPETVAALEKLVPRSKGQVRFVTAGSLAR